MAAVGLLLAAGCGAKSAPASLCAVNHDPSRTSPTDNGVFPGRRSRGGWFTDGDRSGFGTLDPVEGGAAPPTSTREPELLRPRLAARDLDWVSPDGAPRWAPTSPQGRRRRRRHRARDLRRVEVQRHRVLGAIGRADPVRAGGHSRSVHGVPVIPGRRSVHVRRQDPAGNCSPYIVKFGYGYMGEALTPVMEDFPKFISTQIDTTWRRFEFPFDDMRQDSTNPGRQSPGNHLLSRRPPASGSRSTPTTPPPPRRRPTGSCGWTTSAS